MKILEYYFDFMSPYAYLAGTQIPVLADKYRGRVAFKGHSFDMWAARLAAGNTGPSNRDMPARSKVLMADVARWARHYGVPVAPPKGFDMARLNRGFLVARAQGAELPYLRSVFHQLWGLGGDPADERILLAAAAAAGLDGVALARAADSPDIIAQYARENAEAQARGIFGAPMFVIDDQVYWGNDRLAWVEKYIEETIKVPA